MNLKHVIMITVKTETTKVHGIDMAVSSDLQLDTKAFTVC